MLDHMLFNRLKWFNIKDDAESIEIDGKTWQAFPKNVKINDTATALPIGNIGHGTYGVIGVSISNNGKIYIIRTDAGPIAIKSDAVISENWGGNTSLIRLYQRLRSLFYPRREVA